MNGKSLAMGFIIGSVAAGITTLLAAPASGKETKNYLKEHKDEWLDALLEMKGNLNELKGAIAVLSKEGKENITAFVQDVKILVESWQEEIKPNQEIIQSELKAIQNTIQEIESSIETK